MFRVMNHHLLDFHSVSNLDPSVAESDLSELKEPSAPLDGTSRLASSARSTAASEDSRCCTADVTAETPPADPATSSPLSLSDKSSFPTAKAAIVLKNVAIKDSMLRPSLALMLQDIRKLSHDCFDDDVTQLIDRKTGWKINLLVTPGETRLLGFLSYRVRGQSNSLELAKLAVCNDCRHMGYGRRLVKSLLTAAKQVPTVEYVGLSSLAEAVSFYQRLGFRRHDDVKFLHTTTHENEEIIPGQVYMEMKIRSKASRAGGKKK